MSMKTDNTMPVNKKTTIQRSFLDWIGSFGSEDIGVDLGTSNIVVYVKNKGLVFPEASIVAVKESTGEVMAYGLKAAEMEGRTPAGIKIVYPVHAGAIVDYHSAAYLLNSIINQSYLKGMFFHPRLLMCAPIGISHVQKRALLEAAVAIGARKTVLIEQPLAAVMGLGVKTKDREGTFIIDAGGGATKMSIVSRHGVVSSDYSLQSGGFMDEAIINMVMEKYHVHIGRNAAEMLKIALGAMWDVDHNAQVCEVCGISAVSGLPTKIVVTGENVARALNPILYQMFSKVIAVMQTTPPAILEDIRRTGVMLIGGVAQLKGFSELLGQVIDMPIHVADHPAYVNAVGAGSALEYMDYFRDSLQDLH